MRVGGLLLRLVAAAAIVAASVLAAMALLGVDLSRPERRDAAVSAPQPPPTTDDSGYPVSANHADDTSANRSRRGTPLRSSAASSWATLVRSLPARAGIAVAPLGAGPIRTFGSLQSGHAWSTIKVPILTTLMRNRDRRGLSAEEKRWAREALTASDNEAAAALFGQLEELHGGLVEASRAVEKTLRRAGDPSTLVATSAPPPGAVSTFGQTEWSLTASVEFLRVLGRRCLLSRTSTAYVLDLMEEVAPEQRWGLGEADFPLGWHVAIKGGWGPEGSASGSYLVRQSGIVTNGRAGVAVAAMAQADSGSFDAGVEAIDGVAAWLRDNLQSLGRATGARC